MDNNIICMFNAEVWGTVSDWVMIIVTAATGIVIWLTLKSQSEVQKLQQQVTHIENERFRIEIQPEFSLKVNRKSTITVDEDTVLHLVLDFHLTQNECRGLVLKNSSITSTVVMDEVAPNNFENLSAQAHRLMFVTLKTSQDMFDLTGAHLSVNFLFFDIIGNKYTQDVLLSFTSTDYSIDIMSPLRILKQN